MSTITSLLSSSLISSDRREQDENPGAVLDLSMKKQQDGKNNSLVRKVLVESTVRTVQVEINKKIKEAFMFL